MKKAIRKDTATRNALYNAFREFTETDSSDNLQAPNSKPKSQQKSGKNKYDVFCEKYSSISQNIDNFNNLDFVFLFREIAEECGYKYVIANIKKDMHIFKKLRESYSNKEIWDMIEFVYKSEQTYLDRNRFSPNILVSSWCNSIYPDSQLYIKGEYYSNKNKSKRNSQLKKREWNSEYNKDKGIGDW